MMTIRSFMKRNMCTVNCTDDFRKSSNSFKASMDLKVPLSLKISNRSKLIVAYSNNYPYLKPSYIFYTKVGNNCHNRSTTTKFNRILGHSEQESQFVCRH